MVGVCLYLEDGAWGAIAIGTGRAIQPAVQSNRKISGRREVISRVGRDGQVVGHDGDTR
jgi:hypothetical protein